jgi:hypothetical protein
MPPCRPESLRVSQDTTRSSGSFSFAFASVRNKGLIFLNFASMENKGLAFKVIASVANKRLISIWLFLPMHFVIEMNPE